VLERIMENLEDGPHEKDIKRENFEKKS
jgi:hypothetical protein